MLSDFLYNGRVGLDKKSLFLDESNGENLFIFFPLKKIKINCFKGPMHNLHWTVEKIEKLRQSWRTKTHNFLYTKYDNQNIFK